ncbi:sigma-54 dependent transcriptional regulator [Methylomagnum ishizawai]|uniref:DNA-binding transcriptional response regulator, NtrC family, contains REC, AAA-type ATPase, and a Fis-type DNA-binding domains n=1 Tax=Methylomagnum ishizawai TaxID=1760988 RepID=A0A1Y6CSM1_9GAMM|nr:sigma-54 dependent transcriptional regulator [Methylomagnum ishizawai]BBL73334.1 sigma-54-dependent Fis family transcriptional regulator [Methylomagnum ishizawai]SMF93598.1 DNA-binding transcriptional response regulator, NtrC family, contains REC, AAA-type ATPase, and a Fis-type DNA-binding domains [Methylomagnum ishizawai]
MDTRKLLCFDPTGTDNGVLDALRARGWDIITVTRLDEAKNLIDAHGFHLGMVLFGSREQADISPIQSLLAMRYPMEWIALLPPQALHNREVCQLIAQGFYDYHTLPLDPERLQFTLGHAYGMALVMKRLRAQTPSHGDEGIIGCSPKFTKLFADIERAAGLDVPVLVRGENGSGKEIAARAIHRRSMRGDRPFIVVSCGALPSNLMMSELFGFEKGAFAGAYRTKEGSIEAASGGTLFLDEVGELPADLQEVMLRFLREKTIRRVGGDRDIPVDVRIIAASHTDLAKAVADGHFLEELYQALSPFVVNVPSLRERRDDIELLAKYYLDLFVNEKYRHISGYTPEAVTSMQRYEWPGNIRELINRVRRAMVMCEDRWITPQDLGLNVVEPGTTKFQGNVMTLDEAKAEAEKEIIQVTLRATENNISRAARQLAVSRMTLYRLMDKHRIRNTAAGRG